MENTMNSYYQRLIPIVAYARTNNLDTSSSFSGSINEQFESINCWAKFNKCKVVAEYADKCVSGLHKEPPGLKTLVHDFNHGLLGASYIVVCEFNRITRCMEVYKWFQSETIYLGVSLISLSESCSCAPNLTNQEKAFLNSYLETINKKE
jgi:hypothetical protein